MRKQNNTYDYQKLRGLTRKLHLIDLRGGACEKCGYNENLAALDFHHINPAEKENQLDQRKLSNSTMVGIMEEFEKCQVLCSNCHRAEHFPNSTIKALREKLILSESDKILMTPIVTKTLCLDCQKEISYSYIRCRPCSAKSKRQVERPDLTQLALDIETFGYSEMGRRYNVSAKTIKRWIIRNIQ